LLHACPTPFSAPDGDEEDWRGAHGTLAPISSGGESGKSSPDSGATGLLELALVLRVRDACGSFLGSFLWSDFILRQTRPQCRC